jgi:hypothetical protein
VAESEITSRWLNATVPPPLPNAFIGTINTVTIDVSGELIEDDEATMRWLMAHQ